MLKNSLSQEAKPPNIEAQIQFARHTYENHQAMIRLADSKAAFVLTLLIFLSYTAFSFIKESLAKVSWTGASNRVLGTLLILTTIAFLAGLLATLISMQRVVSPRVGRGKFQSGQNLFFSSDVVAYDGREAYFAALRAAPDDLLLQNLAHQVYEISVIAEAKLQCLRHSNRLIVFCICCWTIDMTVCLTLVYLVNR